jgi:hypothetical protein
MKLSKDCSEFILCIGLRVLLFTLILSITLFLLHGRQHQAGQSAQAGITIFYANNSFHFPEINPNRCLAASSPTITRGRIPLISQLKHSQACFPPATTTIWQAPAVKQPVPVIAWHTLHEYGAFHAQADTCVEEALLDPKHQLENTKGTCTHTAYAWTALCLFHPQHSDLHDTCCAIGAVPPGTTTSSKLVKTAKSHLWQLELDLGILLDELCECLEAAVAAGE